MRSLKAALAALSLIIIAEPALAQAPAVTITCGNPGVMCGTATSPIVTTPASGGTSATNITQFGGNPVATGAGASGLGVPRVTVSNDSTVGIVAGAALIGAVETFHRLEVTPTVQNAQYVSGNDIGGLVSFTLPRTASGLLQSVGIQFVGGATTAINVTCFDSNPTGSTFTDKSTFTIAAADEAKRINKSLFQLTPVAATGDSVTAASIDNYAQPFNSTATIYCAYVATGTFTPATVTDMRVNIKIALSAQ